MPASTQTTTLNENITAVTRVLMALSGGMTQTQLAQTMGVDKATISKCFKGFRPWKIEHVEALAEVFDVSPATFFASPEDAVRSRCGSVARSDHFEQLSLSVAA